MSSPGLSLNRIQTLVVSLSSEIERNAITSNTWIVSKSIVGCCNSTSKGSILPLDQQMSKEKGCSSSLKALNKRTQSKQKWKNENQSKVNASERERNQRLKANLMKLKEILPAEPIKLQTKESVLEEALKYIQQLKEKNEEMLQNGASENIATEMKNLRNRSSDLEKERKFYLAVLQAHGLLPMIGNKLLTSAKVKLPRLPSKSRHVQEKEIARTSISMESVETQTSETVLATSNFSNLQTSDKSTMVNMPATSFASVISPDLNSSSSEHLCSLSNTTACNRQSDNSSIATVGNLTAVVSDSTLKIVSKSRDSPHCMFPSVDTLFRPILSASCTPTYCLARVSNNVAKKIPELAGVVTEAVRRNSQVTASLSATLMHAESAPAVGCTTHNSTSSKTVSSLDNSTSHEQTRTKNSSNSTEQLVERTGLRLSLTNKSMVMIPSTSIAPTLTSSNVGKLSVTSIAAEFSSSSCVITTSQLPSSDRNLLSWLRGFDVSLSENSSRTICSHLTVGSENKTNIFAAAQSDTEKSKQCPTASIKKDKNSFNIASLMKSKDRTTCYSPTSDISNPTTPSKQNANRLPLPVESESQDYGGTIAKDILHQSFDNDFFDYLQHMPSLTTPEPPSRHFSTKLDTFSGRMTSVSATYTSSEDYYFDGNNSTKNIYDPRKQKSANVPVELHDLLQAETSYRLTSSFIAEKAATSGDQSMVSRFVQHPQLVENSGHSLANNTSAKNKHSSGVFPKYSFSNQAISSSTAIGYVPPNTTSLWQPAMISTTSSRPIMSNLAHMPIPDCFSPMARPYLNTSTPRHNLATQTPAGYTANQAWMASSVQSSRHRDIQSTMLPSSCSVVTSTAQDSGKAKGDLPKKRKAPRSSQTSKQKKSNSKLAPSAVPRDSRTIPHFVGYPHSGTSQQHRFFATQTPAFVNSTVIGASYGMAGPGNAPVGRTVFAPGAASAIGQPNVGYNPDYQVGQPSIFHSPATGMPPNPTYHAPHPGYHFPYGHTANPSQPPGHIYVPHFANTNNNNNNSNNNTMAQSREKQPKGSQHHIRQILS